VDLADSTAVAIGAVVVAWVLVDSFQTLLATNIRVGRFSLASNFYRVLWKSYRLVCVRLRSEHRRERWLARFGPASFVSLLGLWTFGEIAGWGLIWWGFRGSFSTPIGDLGEALYYSGVVFFSIGFGDLLPTGGGLRFLTIIEGFSGLGTLGLVIGYLPSLYAAYSARERQLLLLDDLTDARITPVSLVRSRMGPDGDASQLEAMFDEWAAWCADVYDSHTSLPVLIWFRSKHRGHSWITGLGVVTDAAMAFAAAVPGSERGAAMRLQRQSVRLVTDLAERIGLAPDPAAAVMSNRLWSVGYSAMQQIGVPLRSFDDSFARLTALRAEFHPHMEAFIDELLAPRGFWGVSASDHLAEAGLDGIFDPS
jgi:hypothetical protein